MPSAVDIRIASPAVVQPPARRRCRCPRHRFLLVVVLAVGVAPDRRSPAQASVWPLSGQAQTTAERTEPVYQLTAIYAYPESPEVFVVPRSGVLDLQTAQNPCGNGQFALNDPDHTYGSVK